MDGEQAIRMCVEGSPTDEKGDSTSSSRSFDGRSGSPDSGSRIPDDRSHSPDGRAPDLSSTPKPLDEDSFVRSETKRLRRIAKDLLPSQNDRDDLVQDVWLEALEHPPRERGRLSAWLHVVAKHAARRLWRRSRSREARERIAARSESEPSVLDELEQEAAKAELRQRIEALSPPYREVVRLHLLEDASPREIAERLSRPMATVRSQLRRGLGKLRSR